MTGYAHYYQRAIDTYPCGVKRVLGPTGLGKSSRIPDVVRANPGRKFVYMANRKQLLEEMAAEDRFKPGEYVILRRDLEVVQQVLLTQSTEFEALLTDQRFKTYLKRARQKSGLKSLEQEPTNLGRGTSRCSSENCASGISLGLAGDSRRE